MISSKSFIKKMFIASIFSLFSSSLFAGILIEPYVGYNLGLYDTQTLGIEYDYKGTHLGARVGGTFAGLQAGLEYNKNSYTFETDNQLISAANRSIDQDVTHIGAFLGYKLPILPIRAWGTYYFSNKYEESNGDETTGTGYALGVGLSPIPVPLPFISLMFNLEYRSFTLDESKSGAVTTSLNPDYKTREIIFSVSVPINI